MFDDILIKTIKINMQKIINSFPDYYNLIDENEIYNFYFKTNYYVGEPRNEKGIYIFKQDDNYVVCENNCFNWNEENKIFSCLDDLYYYFLTMMISNIASYYGIRYRKKYGDVRIGCQIISFEIMNIFEKYRDRFKKETILWMEEQKDIDWEPVYKFIKTLDF